MDLFRPPLLWVVLALLAMFVFAGLHSPASLGPPVPIPTKS
jgi:hypothetical protein